MTALAFVDAAVLRLPHRLTAAGLLLLLAPVGGAGIAVVERSDQIWRGGGQSATIAFFAGSSLAYGVAAVWLYAAIRPDSDQAHGR